MSEMTRFPQTDTEKTNALDMAWQKTADFRGSEPWCPSPFFRAFPKIPGDPEYPLSAEKHCRIAETDLSFPFFGIYY